MFNKKKNYFKQKLDGVQKMVWDLEFKIAKTRAVREEIREAYDNRACRLDVKINQIKQEALPPEEIARLNDEKVILERDIDRFKKQMDGLDIEINGLKPTNEYPNGVQGISQQIDSLQELKKMLLDYIKEI